MKHLPPVLVVEPHVIVVDDDQAEVDAVWLLAAQVIGIAVAAIGVAGAAVVGAVLAARAGWRKLTRIRGW